MCDKVIAAPPCGPCANAAASFPVGPSLPIAPILGCNPAPNRAPQVFQEITKYPGCPGQVHEVVRRLPTPTAHVIEKTFIEQPGQHTVNVIYERPTTPPPNIIEKRLVEAPPPAQVNCFERRVPHRPICAEPVLAAIAAPEQMLAPVVVSTAAPGPVACAPCDAQLMSSHLVAPPCTQTFVHMPCHHYAAAQCDPCAQCTPYNHCNPCNPCNPYNPCGQMAGYGQCTPCSPCMRHSRNMCRRHIATPCATAQVQHFQPHLAVQQCGSAQAQVVQSHMAVQQCGAAQAQVVQSHMAVQQCGAAQAQVVQPHLTVQPCGNAAARYVSQYDNAPGYHANGAQFETHGAYLAAAGQVQAPVNYTTVTQYGHGPVSDVTVVRRDM